MINIEHDKKVIHNKIYGGVCQISEQNGSLFSYKDKQKQKSNCFTTKIKTNFLFLFF